MHCKNSFIAALLLLLFSSNLYADITLYVTESYRDGGEFEDYFTGRNLSVDSSNATAFIISKAVNKAQSVEFTYSYQSTELSFNNNRKLFDVDISYFHLGGTNQIAKTDRVEAYVVGGLGATYFSPDSGYSSETRFSFSLGLGAKYNITERLVLRSDIKFFSTLLNSGSGIFCGGSSGGGGGCSVAVSGSTANQFEAGVGLGYKF
ncbi:MAG: opacity protein-like surface antigen [Halioglobus sp.]|jgi:opacity protein-like surface antigen